MSLRWKRLLALMATGLWLWFIFARSAQTAEESGKESGAILELFRVLIPSATDIFVRKLAHFTEYFVLGGLAYWDWRLLGLGPWVLPLVFCAGAACMDELVIQVGTPGRSGELRDVLLDTLGAAAAIGLCRLLRWGKERRTLGKNGKET